MKAYVITLEGHEYSEACSERCIKTARDIGGIEVNRYGAIQAHAAQLTREDVGLKWTWGKGYGGMTHHDYGGNHNARLGCALSHYFLWDYCVYLDEPILILEHDAIFVRKFPDFSFEGICQINDPTGATPRGEWWAEKMAMRGPGVHPKTSISRPERPNAPDGLAGNSAYVIKPWAAERLIYLYKTIGIWPNDATMCLQFFPYLEELYPFVTRVEQTRSTTSE